MFLPFAYWLMADNFILLKLGSDIPKNFVFFNDSPSKMMKNAFYFIVKSIFVLKVFKFLSWFFGYVEKTDWLDN